MATGLLIICTGKETKNIVRYQNERKIYTGELVLGASTSSYDLETEIDQTYPIDHISKDLIINKALDFVGEIKQKPHIFCTKNKWGKTL